MSNEQPKSTEEEHKPDRSKNQRRRLLVAAVAGVPAIVASSAQTAYAQTGGTNASTGNTI